MNLRFSIVVNRSEATLEELFSLLPNLEELELLRLALVGVSVPHPDKEWDSSAAYATVDKRIVTRDRLEAAVGESEEALKDYVASLYATTRTLFQSFWVGGSGEAGRHLIELGEQQERTGRYGKARQCYDSALSLSLPLADKTLQILSLRRVARVALAQGDLQEAWLYYQRSAELARDTGDLHGEVVARTGLGNVRTWQGRWAEAEVCYKEVLYLVETVDTASALLLERAQLYNNLGSVTTRQMHLDEAETWFDRALALWQVLTQPYDLAVCYHNLGYLRVVQGRDEEAREIYYRALSFSIPAALRSGIAIDLAECYLHAAHVTQAEHWGREAEEQAVAARSPYRLGRMYHGRGNIARSGGDDGGFTFYEKALQIAREKGYPLLEGETLVDYALLRSQMGERDEAQAYLERARDVFIELGAIHEQARAEHALREIAGDGEKLLVIAE